jgi:ABC-type nitrate/sulfonate/bicarbonate transport system substrate-binding protein
VRRGVGTIVLDVRRSDGPKRCFNYTMAAVAATERQLAAAPALAGATIRAIAKSHAALRADLALATKVGRKLFPPQEAELIAALIARDLPYYDTAISETFVASMNAFARDMGILRGDVAYRQIVVPQLRAANDP